MAIDYLQVALNRIKQAASNIGKKTNEFIDRGKVDFASGKVSNTPSLIEKPLNTGGLIDYPVNRVANFVNNNYANSIRDIRPAAKGIINPEPMNIAGVNVSGNPARVINAGRLAFDVLGAIPDPTDLLFAGYNFNKGMLKANKEGQGVKAFDTAIKAATGEAPVGLGDAISSNKIVSAAGNLVELPIAFGASIIAGKLNKKNLEKDLKLASEDIYQFQNMAKDIDSLRPAAQMELFQKAESLLKRLRPDVAKSKELQNLAKTHPRQWLDFVDKTITDTVLSIRGENYDFGLSTKKLNTDKEGAKQIIKNIISTTGKSDTQNYMAGLLDDTKTTTKQIIQPTTNKSGQTISQPIINKNPTKEQVAASIPGKIENLIQQVLGYSTKNPIGGEKTASLYTKTLRSIEGKVSSKVEAGLASENKYIRNAAQTLQGFFKGLGTSPDRSVASAELRGEIASANQRAYDVMDSLYQSLSNKKQSLERINAVLDPELAKNKIGFKDLTPNEQKVYNLIRSGFDLVHDISYSNGGIDSKLYTKNQGKYTPRLYDVFEVPPEVDDFLKQGKKMANDLYKKRDILNDWKTEHSLNDPVYSLGKRLAQVETNAAIKKYTDFLASNPTLISDVERPGFTKLSESPAYGALSGKYVLNSAAEELKGFFFSNESAQKLYDVFRVYDKLPIRQLQKKLLTVFNPTTNVGNIVSDQVFGFLTGVDPLTLNKNLLALKENKNEAKQLNDYLLRKNITGTDITRTDFLDRMGKINELVNGEGKNKLKMITDKVESFYGGTDDAYKLAAFKSLLDKGFTLQEATKKVADGFQNYSNVGKFYDVWAKTPVVGSTFIKFQGDLLRIIKNAAVNNPLGLITFLGTLEGVSLLTSKLSGETPEDYKTRTERFASPMIPGLNIPLAWQTPWGELNVARYISPFFANNDTTSLAKMIPFIPTINTKKDVATNIATNVNDPLLSTPVQLLVNRDFRGKPISDPNENKYQSSTLTPGEKFKNQALFTGRSYLPPFANSAIDVASVAGGGTDMYGRKQTVPQAIARLGGIKITQFGPEEAQNQRNQDAEYQQYANETIDKQINSVKKQLLKGEVTQEQANKRIKALEDQKQDVQVPSINRSGDYQYIDSNGTMRTIRTTDVGLMPEDTNYQKALKQKKAYDLVGDILDSALPTDKQSQALGELGISIEDATYYNIARQTSNLKKIFTSEEANRILTTTNDRGKMLEYLISQRREVNNEMVLTDTVVNELYKDGLISQAEQKMLKNLTITQDGKPKTKLTGRGRKTFIKRVSAPKLNKLVAPKIKSMKQLLSTKTKIKTKRYNFRKKL